MIKTSSKQRGIKVSEIVTDIGSGMNTKKRGFLRVMNLIITGRLSHLVLLHKDRLLRFGSDLVFLICRSMGVRVTILEESPAQTCMEQLSADLVEIITVFSARLYGMRSHQNKKSRDAQLCSTSMATA